MKRLAICLLFAALILLSIRFIDRPIADFCFWHFRAIRFELRFYLDLLLTPAILALGVLSIALALASSQRRTRIVSPALAIAATAIAIAAETLLKLLFGRSDADPNYLYDHQYAFHFFHAARHWESFPSGTASVAFAIAAVLALTAPRLKIAVFSIATLVCLWVLAANAHWLSDLLAGALLGIYTGHGTVQLLRRRLQ